MKISTAALRLSALLLTSVAANWAHAGSCEILLTGLPAILQPRPNAGETSIGQVTAVAQSVRRNLVAVGYADGTIRFFHRGSGQQLSGKSVYNDGYLKDNDTRVSFLGFMEDDQVLVARHPGPSKSESVGYYFDIRTFFKPCLVQYRIIIGKVWGKSSSELMKKLVVNYEQERRWPDSPVPLKCR